MSPTLRLAETVWLRDCARSRRRPDDARESLDGIEPEVRLVYDWTKLEKSLDESHLTSWITDESLAVYEVDL